MTEIIEPLTALDTLQAWADKKAFIDADVFNDVVGVLEIRYEGVREYVVADQTLISRSSGKPPALLTRSAAPSALIKAPGNDQFVHAGTTTGPEHLIEGSLSQDTCTSCRGRGRIRHEGCGGKGETRCPPRKPCPWCTNGRASGNRHCTSCNGRGHNLCAECNGSGWRKCGKCTNGERTCRKCQTTGKVTSYRAAQVRRVVTKTSDATTPEVPSDLELIWADYQYVAVSKGSNESHANWDVTETRSCEVTEVRYRQRGAVYSAFVVGPNHLVQASHATAKRRQIVRAAWALPAVFVIAFLLARLIG